MGGSEMDKEIVKADPAIRKKLLGGLIIVVVIGLLASLKLSDMIRDLANSGDPDAFVRLMRFLLPVILLFPISFAVWMIQLARKIISEQCYPPLNQKVIKDTIRVYGKAARVKGYVLGCLGLVLIVLSILSALLAFRIFDSFL